MLKTILLCCITFTLLAGCKKNAGQYCPVIDESGRGSRHLVDISGITWISAIADTLARHPELQVMHYDQYNGDSYYQAVINISCNIYYKDLRVFNHKYSLSVIWPRNGSSTVQSNDTLPLKVGNVSIVPAISSQKAIDIAMGVTDFKGCPGTVLGLMDFTSTFDTGYKLVWKVSSVESGSPAVVIDAQTGQVFSGTQAI